MSNTRILVIEDDTDARMMYKIMLRSWGYDVHEANSGSEGIKIALREKPDLILLDIMMPDMDGYAVCQQLRSNPGFHQVPILFLTALDSMDDRIKGYTIGGDDFLTKSEVEYKEMGVRIKAALERAERMSRAGEAASPGTIVGMISLRGGVGVTTLAVHLARYATSATDRPVILIDLAFPVGSISLWSGITGPRHSVTLLSRSPADINLNLIRDYCQQNVYGAYFIPGPSSLTDLGNMRMQAIERVLEVLREAGYVVILDLGRGTLPLIWRTLPKCDWITTITSADATSRALARLLMDALPGHDINPRSVILAYNDLTDQKPADIALGLPRTPDVFIPFAENFDTLSTPSPFARLWGIIAAEEQQHSESEY